ncbi:MAG: DUF1972 domain-containing protein [Pseudomonadota bacterium]
MHLNILGCRGIPPAHGGFETFAQALSLHLVRCGWDVNVYCQDDDEQFEDGQQDVWRGITRTHFQSALNGPYASMQFDYKCTRHVLDMPGIDLVLGYNTAVFSLLQRLKRRRVLMNMDGIEWRRPKWAVLPKAWFMFNEMIGCNFSSVVIADHPEIGKHLNTRTFKTPRVIPYGADVVTKSDSSYIHELGLQEDKYLISIARIEPENSVLEIVQAAAILPAAFKIVIVGKLDEANAYHRAVYNAGRDSVIFAGGVYEKERIEALRLHSRGYLHGHKVGGTNPSLVEALGAGNPVIAHRNRFNLWTAGPEQQFFQTSEELRECIVRLCTNDAYAASAATAARKRHSESFRWSTVLAKYEKMLMAEHVKIETRLPIRGPERQR